MGKCIWIVVLALALLSSCGTPKPAAIKARAQCSFDRARLMALDQQHFDQDTKGGWRAVAHRSGCMSIAADLIRDYRQAHHSQSSTLYWHEAQLRANAGDYKQAIPLMEQSREPKKKDFIGWNDYVDATIAFLRKDRAALADARAKLAAVHVKPGSGFPPAKNGFVEVRFGNGMLRKVRWPFNLDVVDGLIHCFDKSYKVAYGGKGCRPATRRRR